MDEVLQELVQLMKDVSPDLWRIAMQQVKVTIFLRGLVAAASLIFTIIGISCSIKCYNDDEDELGQFFLAIFVVAVVFTIAFGVAIIGPAVNPEYYAIKELLNLLP